MRKRELSDTDAEVQADQLRGYLRKAGNRGASFWLTSKGFSGEDRRAILLALGEEN